MMSFVKVEDISKLRKGTRIKTDFGEVFVNSNSLILKEQK